MSTEEIISRFEATTKVIERMFRWQLAIITMTATGVLWGARLEWNQGVLSTSVAKIENREEKMLELMAGLKTEQALIKQKIGMGTTAMTSAHNHVAAAQE